MNKAKTYSPEVRERAVRMVFDHTDEHASQWAAILDFPLCDGHRDKPAV
jgi:hypothetical protein